jgi:topoisomerase-4 subunit B
MMPAQLKETTMAPEKRMLLRVGMGEDEAAALAKVVDQLMGNKPEERFKFISERAEFVDEEELDV